MAWHVVSDLIVDEHNRAEMARHGVARAEVDEVPWNRHIVSANPRGEPGSVLLIGETTAGVC